LRPRAYSHSKESNFRKTIYRTRRCDVYAGVDVWARNTSYGPGPKVATAVAAVVSRPAKRQQKKARAGLSLALFAPGWTLEAGQVDTVQGDAHFWQTLKLDAVRDAEAAINERES